jgi:hypothetical protein
MSAKTAELVEMNINAAAQDAAVAWGNLDIRITPQKLNEWSRSRLLGRLKR